MIARVQLESLGEQETLLRYTAQADIGGKLASVGSRLVQGVAKKNADDFFTALTRQLTGQGHSEDAELAANSQKKSSKAKTSESLDRAQLLVGGGGLGAPVPAWIVVFGTALGIALGYCLGLLAR